MFQWQSGEGSNGKLGLPRWVGLAHRCAPPPTFALQLGDVDIGWGCTAVAPVPLQHGWWKPGISHARGPLRLEAARLTRLPHKQERPPEQRNRPQTHALYSRRLLVLWAVPPLASTEPVANNGMQV